jgi:arylamine N-acetyltransferase
VGNSIDLNVYFQSIGIEKPSECTLENLNRMIIAHISLIPYQNFDLVKDSMNGVPKSTLMTRLEPREMLNRLLEKKRGGMCYETSELLY